MNKKLIYCLLLASFFCACSTPTPKASGPAAHATVYDRPVSELDPSELYGELFTRVQLGSVFPDSKYFVDMTPKFEPAKIMNAYRAQAPSTPLQLKNFVEENFSPPDEFLTALKESKTTTIEKHIKLLWTYLKHSPDQNIIAASSLIPLPNAYIVPGGRFREIYYWDSYFTQLGLLADHEDETFQNMVQNFAYLQTHIGRIPNGNRDYYRGRSQPPFFSLMVALWQTRYGAKSASQFLPALRGEYDFWMKSTHKLAVNEAEARIVRLDETSVLNRYWDDRNTPRPEAYKEDFATAQKALNIYQKPLEDSYRDLRASAESGWDFSSRWFKDPLELASVQTTSFIPVDLNSLLYNLETKLAELYKVADRDDLAQYFLAHSRGRLKAMQKYLWDNNSGTFRDYNWKTQLVSPEQTLAMVVPLFLGVATPDQAKKVAQVIESKFLKAGGLVTTEHTSGQQWDAPNGWAPHQWMAYAGLRRYGQNDLAEKIRTRWLALNLKIFKTHGRLTEKYNVVDLSLSSGGGEYATQDGFGWTNGVYRALSTQKNSLKHLIR